jgi:outer membrane protein OmpA-like peptidoglycan-associated protein
MTSIRPQLHFSLIAALAVGACASEAPSAELIAARNAYAEATRSAAQRLAPAKVLAAKQALDAAERVHADDARSTREKAYAYAAERAAKTAIAYGNVAEAEQRKAQAEQRYTELQGTLRQRAESELDRTKRVLQEKDETLAAKDEALSAKDQALTEREKELQAERDARLEAEEEAKAAVESLKEIAMVKEEERGMVITLSGEVLFETGKATLLPIARQRLTQVANALKESTDKTITILGHTDNRGSDDFNLRLSQDRADAVRQFLISQDIEPSRVRAEGKGEREPIAENRSPEGRANNRRVEIVLSNDNA